MLRTVIDHGITEGVFSDVDAEHAAQALMTTVDGARTRAVVLDDSEALKTARRAADEYVTAVLLDGNLAPESEASVDPRGDSATHPHQLVS